MGTRPLWVMLLFVCVTAPACSASHAPSAANKDLPSAPIAISDEARIAADRAGVDLRTSARETLAKTLEFFPDNVPNISIEVKSRGSDGFAVSGFTTSSTGQVFVYLNPDYEGDFSKALKIWFPATLAHELDHSARIFDGPGIGRTLLDGMISEGLAEAFALEIYPDTPLVGIERGLTTSELRRLWALAQPHLHDVLRSKMRGRWFFGRGDLPDATGYVLGFEIVRAYLRSHPDVTAHELTLEPAGKIFRGSAYNP